ncbi:MAG: septum formation protein Maf [Micavibrio sp.]|nr:septum formation protein Maf [Micavibrio sp.]
MKNKSPQLILASASPRRSALLETIGITPSSIQPADLNEEALKGELPPQTALRLSQEKAKAIAAKNKDVFVLAADTLVACGRRELPKAETEDQARFCLELLSGRRHCVYGGITLVTPEGKMVSRLVTTRVQFKKLSKTEIEEYIQSKEWDGKAGGYGIQGLASAYVKNINGSYTNIVGLSLYDTLNMLKGNGFH